MVWEEHLVCQTCEANPTVARLDGKARLVCHCTHVGGEIDPWPIHGFEAYPERWEWVGQGVREVEAE